MRQLFHWQLGFLIQNLLIKTGNSQKWLSEKTGLSTNSISSICRADNFPSQKTLLKIEDALRIDFSVIATPRNRSSKIFDNCPFSHSQPELREAWIMGVVWQTENNNSNI